MFQPSSITLASFLALLAAGGSFAADAPLPPLAATKNASPVREIVVVFKTHYDIGYTDLITNILNRYRTKFADRGYRRYSYLMVRWCRDRLKIFGHSYPAKNSGPT